jgi:hypothetical protein
VPRRVVRAAGRGKEDAGAQSDQDPTVGRKHTQLRFQPAFSNSVAGDIRTEYNVRVDSLIKGPQDTPSTIAFAELGGSTGFRTRSLSPSVEFIQGGTYLFFLARCEGNPHYRNSCSASIARIEGGQARVWNPATTVAWPALGRHTGAVRSDHHPRLVPARPGRSGTWDLDLCGLASR